MCSLNTECALLTQNVLFCHGMCSLTIECVLLEVLVIAVLSNAGTDKEVQGQQNGDPPLGDGVGTPRVSARFVGSSPTVPPTVCVRACVVCLCVCVRP